jgi:hypothetical protein
MAIYVGGLPNLRGVLLGPRDASGVNPVQRQP